MTFNYRAAAGFGAERSFTDWVHMNAGWHSEPYGQGLMSEEGRKMLRSSGFNGNSCIVENLIAGMSSDERRVYMGRVGAVPCLTRWLPDRVVAYRSQMVFCPDVKTAISKTPNHAVEMSSLLGAQVHSQTGVACLYVFPPNDFVSYWACATPEMIRQRASTIMDGRNTYRGSGTPFYLVPKRAIDTSLRHLMTEFELNGVARLGDLHL